MKNILKIFNEIRVAVTYQFYNKNKFNLYLKIIGRIII